jgi:hypothetical protein
MKVAVVTVAAMSVAMMPCGAAFVLGAAPRWGCPGYAYPAPGGACSAARARGGRGVAARGCLRRQPRPPAAAAGAPTDKDFAQSLDSAEALVLGLRSRTSADGAAALDVETDFFDPSTGLHSEGVWHNAMIGIACLALAKSGRTATYLKEAPRRIAASLFDLSWDGVSFARRAHSGRWGHSPSAVQEQPAYYFASGEHRCVQHGISCVFWCQLREADPEAAKDFATIATSFVDQFWDEEAAHWCTISKTQGVATGARPSASTGQPFLPAATADADRIFEQTGGADQVYYRAVDHAVALLALVSMEKGWQPGDPLPRERLQDLIRLTSQQLLSPAGFGFGGDYSVADPNPWARAYIGIDRQRNFWHDAWVCLALSRARGYAAGHTDLALRSLLTQLVGLYGGPDGTVWHWPLERKGTEENVRYCGDNALLHAICAELEWAPEPQGSGSRDGAPPSRTQERINLKKQQRAFWDFVGELRSHDRDALASVGDVYKQVRLHPNSELAALLVWKMVN